MDKEERQEQQDQIKEGEWSKKFFEASRSIADIIREEVRASRVFGMNYKKEDIKKWLLCPAQYEKQLRTLSKELYNASQHYKRLVEYFANMAILSYILIPDVIITEKEEEKVQRSYYRIAKKLNDMNLQHELRKVLKEAFVEDIFYGIENEEPNNYWIQQLPANYCKVTGYLDGVRTFSFDMTFFDKYPEQLQNAHPELRQGYREYKNRKNKRGTKPDDINWVQIDPYKSICFKVNETLEYAIPPLAGIFPDIFDLEDFKFSRSVRDSIGKYILLIQKIPMLKDNKPNAFAIDAVNAKQFHQMATNASPSEVNVITTPMEIEAINLAPKENLNHVEEAKADVYASAGVNQHLFSTDKTTSAALEKSINVDEQIVFAVLLQLERWINRKIKGTLPNNNFFKVSMLPVTYFNQEKMFNMYQKAAQFGAPTKMAMCAVLGYTPLDIINQSYLENDIFELHNQFIPLQSSHTQGANAGDEGGRPQKDLDDLGEEGLRTRDGDKNSNR